VSLALDVAPQEDAVVLLEHDGCYTWLRPRHESSRDPQLVGRVAVFEFVLPPVEAGSRDLGTVPAGAARATVLSYASPLLASAAIRALEVFVDPGLVHVTDVDPSQWRHVGSLTEAGLSADRNNRVLLLVHGTFDSTAGAFGGLAATEPGRAFLTEALDDYDAVVGFDHRTLSVDPLQNARELAALLTPFRGRQVTFDVVCHSRGGLTARSFVEEVLPGLAWRGKVDRAVFIGATNAGTHFADVARWADLADLYINLVAANARGIAALPGGAPIAAVVVAAVRGIGALVRWLASYATDPDSVPGIAAMTPDGPFVTTLNEDQPGQPRSGTPWFVVSSDFEATVDDHPPEMPAAVITRLVDGVVDEVFEGPNDLVVDVESMSAVDLSHGGGYVRDALALSPNSVVYHTNYVTQSTVCDALTAWLIRRVDHLEGEERAVPVPDTEPVGERISLARAVPRAATDRAAPRSAPGIAGRAATDHGRAATDHGRATARRLVRRGRRDRVGGGLWWRRAVRSRRPPSDQLRNPFPTSLRCLHRSPSARPSSPSCRSARPSASRPPCGCASPEPRWSRPTARRRRGPSSRCVRTARWTCR
jgi:hypothetical protein